MKLYKYLAPDRIEVLENCLIRHTQPQDLNDPFEMRVRPWFESLFPPNVTANKHSGTIAEKVAEKFTEKFIHGITEWMEKEFHKDLLVLCLTERNDNRLMWAHYALSHQGFVIGFDSEHPYFDRGSPNHLGGLKKVHYRNERPNQAKDYSVLDVLLTKSIDWEYEQEWRIFRTVKEADKVVNPTALYPVYLFNFPPAAVTEVILGKSISKKNQEAILRIVKNSSPFHHVIIRQAYLSDSDYQVHFKKITA